MKSGQQGYELIDFGDGRKLERFGSVTIDRPARGAWSPKAIPDAWESAELIYQGDRMNAGQGAWQSTSTSSRSLSELLSGWVCSVHGLTLQVTPQSTGQLGVFPEHWNQGLVCQQDRCKVTSRASASLEPICLHGFVDIVDG